MLAFNLAAGVYINACPSCYMMYMGETDSFVIKIPMYHRVRVNSAMSPSCLRGVSNRRLQLQALLRSLRSRGLITN